MRIIGIDPGSVICGYGVVEYNKNSFALVEYGIIRPKKINEDFSIRLKEIFLRLTQVVDRSQPELSAFETMFYARNAQSLIKLSHARAAAMLPILLKEIPVAEYSPREVKKAVTGKGNATKEQVQYMVKTILKITETPEFFDVTDALAVAICHGLRQGTNKSSTKSWKDYLKQNPDKIVKV